MKKKCGVMVVSIMLCIAFPIISKAQDPITLIIKEGVTKVIKAVDLQIQRLQNETIWLQNAQKVVENTMSKLKLEEIASWAEKQHTLYSEYYDELWRVKDAVAYYHKIREVSEMQLAIVKEYKRAFRLFKQDQHFSTEEIHYMQEVYSGMLQVSIKNLDQLFLVIESFSTQMSDGQRMQIIEAAASGMEDVYKDLKKFNTGGVSLSLQRAKDLRSIGIVKALYGLE